MHGNNLNSLPYILIYHSHLFNGRCFFIGASDVGMIDFFQPDNFQTLAMIVIAIASGTCVVVSGLASWTLVYIIGIARDMAATKTSCQAMAASLAEFKQENEHDHEGLHTRVTGVEKAQVLQGATLVEHGINIQNLQKGSC